MSQNFETNDIKEIDIISSSPELKSPSKEIPHRKSYLFKKFFSAHENLFEFQVFIYYFKQTIKITLETNCIF